MVHLYFDAAASFIILCFAIAGLGRASTALAWAEAVHKSNLAEAGSQAGTTAPPGTPHPIEERTSLLVKWQQAGILGAGMPTGLLQRTEVPRQQAAGHMANLLATGAVVCTLVGIMLLLLEAPAIVNSKSVKALAIDNSESTLEQEARSGSATSQSAGSQVKNSESIVELDTLFQKLQPHWVFAPSALALFLGILLQYRQHRVDDALEVAWDHVDRFTLETLLPQHLKIQSQASATGKLETCLEKVESALQQLATLDKAPWAQQMIDAADTFEKSIAVATSSIEDAANNLKQTAEGFPGLQRNLQQVRDALTTSMESITQSGTRLEETLQASNEHLTASTKRLEAFDQASAAIEQHRQGVLDTLSSVEKAIAAHLATLNQRVLDFATTLQDSELSDHINQLHNSLQAYTSQLKGAHDGQTRATDALTKQVKAIGTQATSLGDHVTSLMQQTEGFADRVAGPLEKVKASIGGVVIELGNLLKEQQEQSTKTLAQYGELLGRGQQLQDTWVEAGTQLQDALRTQLEPVGNHLPNLNERLHGLTTLVATREQQFSNQMETLKMMLTDLQRSATGLNEGVDRLADLQKYAMPTTAPVSPSPAQAAPPPVSILHYPLWRPTIRPMLRAFFRRQSSPSPGASPPPPLGSQEHEP